MKTENVSSRQKMAEQAFANIVSQIPLNPNDSHPQPSELERRVEAFLSGKSTYQLMMIPLELVDTDDNIRHIEDENSDPEFKSLVASIQKVGVIQPATLRVVNSGKALRFQCVAGHRRIRAARQAVPGLKHMNFIVRKFENDNLQLITTVIENTHRKSLHPFDLGKSLRTLTEGGMSFTELEHLFERNQWNLRRFDKMNDWNEISRSLVLENKEKFTSTFLLHLASKSLSPAQVEVEIRKKLGLAEGMGRKLPILERVHAYAKDKNLSEDQTTLIKDALVQLGLMKIQGKRGGGRGRSRSFLEQGTKAAQ